MAIDKPTRVLSDHKRKGKRLVPPLLGALGDRYSPYSWTRELVPEFLWIWLLLEKHENKRGVQLANRIGKLASQHSSEEPKPLFAKDSSFKSLSTDQQQAILRAISPQDLSEINAALAPLFRLIGDGGLTFLDLGYELREDEEEGFRQTINSLYDRYGRPTVLTLATGYFMGLEQEKIKVFSNLADKVREDFEHITDYPNTESSKIAAAAFRAAAPMFLMGGDDGGFQRDEEWLKYFWDKVGGLGPCSSRVPTIGTDPVPEEALGRIVFSFRNAAQAELKERLDTWGLDLHNIEVTEVVGALLARQTILVMDFALAPPTWTPQIAPILLRAMADIYVTLAWILATDSKARSAKFVEDGLGSIKLEIAHRKKQMEGMENDEQKAEQGAYIQNLQAWLDTQRLDQLVEINLGSWSGMNTRAMAEEAGCLDFYNYVYQPFSAAVHSSWSHLGQFNVVSCENPAHRHHRIPALPAFEPNAHWLYLAAKYLQKAYDLFDEWAGIEIEAPAAFDVLLDLLAEPAEGNE